MRRRWRLLVWGAVGLSLPSGLLLACVLADPPPIQAIPPPSQPIIIGASASPPLGVPISVQPTDQTAIQFAANVRIDPDQLLQWRVFVDYGSATSGGLVRHSESDGGVGGDGGATVTFDIFALDLGDPAQCHTIELDVASPVPPSTNGFVDTNGPSNVAVDPPGGDRAVWIYQPVGNCNVYDAGAPPPPVEAGADASDGASE